MSLPAQITLSAGLVLSLWARDMKQRVAYLKDLYHTCGWISLFTGIQLRLCDQPLLGDPLATLMAEGYRTEKAEPAVSAKVRKTGMGPGVIPEPHRPADGLSSSWSRKMAAGRGAKKVSIPPRISPSPGRPQSGFGKIDINQLPPRAGYPLLSRLAGEMVGAASDHDPAKSGHRGPAVAGGERKEARLASLTLPGDTSTTRPIQTPQRLREESLSPGGNEADVETWRDSTVQRAARALRRHDFTARRVPEVESALSRQWASRVTGPEVSTQLLQHLAGVSVLVGSAGPDRVTPFAGNDRYPPGPSEMANRSPQVMGPGPVSPPAGNQELSAGPEGVASLSPLLPSRGTTEPGMRTSPEPPDLPPLVAPPSAGVPALPVAAATAQLEAWSEAVAAEDGLDVLAEKIKRILEEEARRHGIDV